MRPHPLSFIINLIILPLILLAGLFLFSVFETKPSLATSVPILFSVPAVSANPIVPIVPIVPVVSLVKGPINLLFFGDLMLDRYVATKVQGKNLDFLLGALASSTNFSQFDLVGANFEGAVTNEGQHYSPEMINDFAFAPSRVAELKKYNFSYFTISNNHVMDQGSRGLAETRNNLSSLGFYYSGDADAKISENSLTAVTLKDKKVALIAFSMVYHNFDLAAAKKMVSEERLKSDFVIINIHWGSEYQHNYNAWQKKIGHELVDSGADIIIGHHPHVVQGMEIYNNHPIFYSLGNFVFDQYFSLDTQEELSLALSLTDKGMEITLQPLISQQSVISFMTDPKKEKFLENFAAWSEADQALKKQIKAQIISIAN